MWLVAAVVLTWGMSGCLRAGFPAGGTVDGQTIDAGVDGGGVDGGTGDAGPPDVPAHDVPGKDQYVYDVPTADATTGCTSAAQCDDHDPCTEDQCDAATGQCAHYEVPGCGQNPCILPGGQPLDCDDGDPCTEDWCDPDMGGCIYKPLPGCGTPCVTPNGQPLDCDDGDPCTEDWCDPDMGGCFHEPIPGCGVVCPSTAECQSDAGCNDQNACTKDLCVNCACEHVQLSNCGPTCDGMVCDDGDPCTSDACFQGECIFEPIPGCGVGPTPTCSSQGVIPIADAQWAPAGDFAKIGGTPQAGNLWACTELACGPDNPCCNTCTGSLRLVDPLGFGMEADTMLDSEFPWSCTADDCGATQSCQPPRADTAYWVWGDLMPGQGYPLPAGVAAMPSNTLGVQGWCIQTNEAGLPGHYEGTLTLDDPVTGTTSLTKVAMDISLAADGAWVIELAPLDAVPGVLAAQQATNVKVGDGFLDFWIEVDAGSLLASQPVHLESWQNSLKGPLGAFGVVPPLPLPPPTGTVSFQKTDSP